MKNLAIAIAFIAAFVPSIIVGSSVFADSPGQLASGGNLYQVRNVTTNTDYSNATSVACNETVKISIEISNTQYGGLTDVTASAKADGTLSVTAKNASNETVTSTGKVTVTVPTGTLSYVAGSTKLLALNGDALKDLPDGIVGGSVNTGSLNGSTREFVQFQETVACPTTPTTPTTSTTPTTTTTTVTELPHTGMATNVIGLLGLGSVIAAAAYFIASRRALNSRS